MNRASLFVITPIVAILALATAFSQRWDAGKPRIGLAVANLQADFFNQIKQSVTKEAAKQGLQVIVADALYTPAGATAAGVPVKDARKAHIPIVAIDRNPPDAPADTFIASNSVASAMKLGEYVAKLTAGQALKENSGLQVVAKQPADWDQDKGFDVAQNMLQSHPDISVFFGRADAMALGAAQAGRVADV